MQKDTLETALGTVRKQSPLSLIRRGDTQISEYQHYISIFSLKNREEIALIFKKRIPLQIDSEPVFFFSLETNSSVAYLGKYKSRTKSFGSN